MKFNNIKFDIYEERNMNDTFAKRNTIPKIFYVGSNDAKFLIDNGKSMIDQEFIRKIARAVYSEDIHDHYMDKELYQKYSGIFPFIEDRNIVYQFVTTVHQDSNICFVQAKLWKCKYRDTQNRNEYIQMSCSVDACLFPEDVEIGEKECFIQLPRETFESLMSEVTKLSVPVDIFIMRLLNEHREKMRKNVC